MAEPVSLELAKQQLRLEADFADEDELISGIIADARAWVESHTGQTLIEGAKVEYLKPACQQLLTWPVNEVTEVSYIDAGGLEHELDAGGFAIRTKFRPARVQFFGSAAYSILRSAAAVKVTMQAGYAAADMPRGAIRAMLILITGYYERRDTGGLGGDVEKAAAAACRNMRLRRL
ncbi:head-tail connector protein [Sphingomonas montanisoli]|uniref:Phage gp6-like head-tail connector protein n=1 Tax=Sphingomonas montanisoli TaxID=2606412 RepID=A0A5D9BYC0_9SPHN|nr:head-tail connector protein [Sphingomonas montanisoli]TZG23887.1 hypothetical protein FYJ91_20450 [Sphingomonas montanisoli]